MSTTTATTPATAVKKQLDPEAPLYMSECREMTAIWSILDSKSLVNMLSVARPDYSATDVGRLVDAADELLTTLVPLNAPPATQRAFLTKLDGMNRFAARLRYQASTAARRAKRKAQNAAAPAAPAAAKQQDDEDDEEAERVIMVAPTNNALERRRLADKARREKHKAAFAAATAAARKKAPEPEAESSESSSSEEEESESSDASSSDEEEEAK